MDNSIYLGAFTKAFEMLGTQFYWFVLLIIFAAVLKSAWFKGVIGEWMVNFIISRNFKRPGYILFKDILLPTEDGTTQLDHVLLSPYGVFVIETKNMKGWIFGKEKQAKWVQQIYKHKSYFQNPLHQNYKHTKVMEELLRLDKDHIKSLIVFIGSATFKTTMPKNVMRGGDLTDYIKSFKTEIITAVQLVELRQQLTIGKLESSFKNKRNHVKHVKEIRKVKQPISKRSNTAEAVPVNSDGCPKCGSGLKLRVAAKGAHKGTKFYGCSSFPKCRYIRKLV